MSLDIHQIATTTHSNCPEDLGRAWAVQRSAKEMLIIDSKPYIFYVICES